jgi:tetratricopeptide (TPR) repeat protein
MIMKNKIQILLQLCLITLLGPGCNKQNEFLAAKPNQSLVVPSTLSDFQAILHNTNVFNSGNDPELGELSTDDFYVQGTVLPFLSPTEINSYSWQQQVYPAGTGVADWSAPYVQVYYANAVLDGLAAGHFPGQQTLYNQLKGTALFYRSYAFYNLVQVFAMPYDAATAATEPGIPLRLSSDVTGQSTRASEQACYSQVISDLQTALPLLPVSVANPTEPSQQAANAMLARVYLALSDYAHAQQYATACLQLSPVLTDYNTLNSPATTAINSTFVSEDIYHSSMVNYSMLAVRRNTVIDSGLYASYAANDLRKTKFFAILDFLPQYPRFVGSYDFTGNKYDGLATDEVYLIRAECYAREGNTTAAMADLNTLLVNRYQTGTFTPLSAATAAAALDTILLERRKELLYRGLRWTDLRRLNQQTATAVTLSRNVNGTVYSLPPNDPRYALPIPDQEIAISGITQNPR